MWRWAAAVVLVAVGVAVLLAGPSVQADLELAGPPRGAVEIAAPPADLSSVTIPVTLALSAIRTQVLAKVPQVVIDAKNEQLEKGLVGDVYAERRGDPIVRSGGGELTIEVPITMQVKPRPGFAKKSKVSIGVVNAEMNVVVTLRPKLSRSWRLKPNATVTYRWITTPKLTLGPVKVDVTKKTDEKLAIRLAEVAADLNTNLPDDLDIRGKLQQAWAELLVPQQVNADPPTWLTFHPTALYASQPWPAGDGLHLSAGASGALELVVSDAPPEPLVAPLPPRSTPPEASVARISAPITLPWDVVTAALQEGVAGMRFTETLPGGGEATVEVTRVLDVYPTGASIAVGIELQGEVAGVALAVRLWLSGRPALHDDALHIEDFEYVVQTDSPWFDLAHDQFADTLRAELAKSLVLPLREQRDEVLAQVNAKLAEPPPIDAVRTKGEVTRADLTHVTVGDDALIVTASLLGELAVTILK